MRTRDGQWASSNTKEMIQEAANNVFRTTAIDQETQSIWRVTSGPAHGLAWAFQGQLGTQQTGTADVNGIEPSTAAGSIERVANNYVYSYHLAMHGSSLLNTRNEDTI